MPSIATVEEDQADTRVRALYLDFQRRMGFPAAPNFIKTQGHSLAVASGTWGLVQNVLVGGVLPRTIKEILFTAISSDRQCQYCEAAHLACCRMLGVEPATLQQLADRMTNFSPAKVKDMVEFGLKCSRAPQSLSELDFQRLRGHGLREPEILELISMSALAVYANIMADATGVEPDAMFSQL
jgi:uncharacterized peroxidase-related enzyme